MRPWVYRFDRASVRASLATVQSGPKMSRGIEQSYCLAFH